jgi:hypothetical protein
MNVMNDLSPYTKKVRVLPLRYSSLRTPSFRYDVHNREWTLMRRARPRVRRRVMCSIFYISRKASFGNGSTFENDQHS